MMKSLYEELGGTYTLGDDGMLYPNLVIGDKDPRPIIVHTWRQNIRGCMSGSS